MIWRSIAYELPQAAWLIFLVFVLVAAYWYLFRYRQTKLDKFGIQNVLNVVTVKRLALPYWIKVGLIAIAWICGIIALMQPKGNERYVEMGTEGDQVLKENESRKTTLRKKQHEVVFLLDASASMSIADMGGKTREDVAKEIVDQVISRLQGQQVALFAFTSATSQIVPLTVDYLFTRLMLREASINEGGVAGTDLKQALEVVQKSYLEKNSGIAKTLVVLTDGGDTHFESAVEKDKQQYLNEILQPLAQVGTENVRIDVVGLGTKQGGIVPKVVFEGKEVHSSRDDQLLRAVGEKGKGKYYIVEQSTPSQVSLDIFTGIDEASPTVEEAVKLAGGDQDKVYDLYFQVPLGIALLALLLFMLLPETGQRSYE